MIFILITLLSGALFKYKISSKSSFLLFLVGIGLHYTKAFQWWEDISAESILIFILPPLIYFSSAHIDTHILKKFTKQLIILNGPILLISISLIAYLFSFIESFLSWKLLFLFGTIISATDPVTIIGILEHLNMSKKVKTLVDGEALLNDAVVFLVYSLLNSTDVRDVILKIFYIPIGSLLLSCAIFFLFFNLMRKIYDSDIEITLSIVFCYGGFYLAEQINISGIFTIVIFGLLVSYIGKTSYSTSIKKSMEHVWETMETNMNHIILTLCGLIGMKSISFFPTHWYKLLIIFVLINLVRIGVIMIFYPFLIHPTYRIYKKQLLLIGLSNIKGALTIVLALEVVEKEETMLLLFYVYGIVFLSLLINPFVVELYIKYGIQHEYDETVEYILHIRNRLEKVGFEIKQTLSNKSRHLKHINWSIIDKNMIKLTNEHFSRSKMNGIELNIQNDTNLEYRTIYLMSLKQSFWRLFDDGQLYRDTLVILLNFVDSVLDTDDRHWETSFEKHCNISTCYTFVPKIFQYKVFYHIINHKHNILSGFILGQEYTIENLQTIFEMDCSIVNQLKEEMQVSIVRAKELLHKIEDEFPDITQKIETRQANYYVLKNQQRFLKRIFKDGKINYYIYNHINQEINKKLH